jgi:AbrB family looped-hinge helix DNA binding protein
MNEIISTITSKGQITLPSEVRRHLGVTTSDKIAFVIEDEGVRIKPVTRTVASLYGSVSPLPGCESLDFEHQIEEALAEEAAQFVERLEHP